MSSEYTANDLTHLEGLEAVRKRPGMYIGSTDSKGLVHLVYEIFDNGVDEALAGHCTVLTITLNADSSITLTDNGRGIPTGINTKTGMSGVEMAYTLLHAGGKFGGSGYKTAGGLHGVGASVVNALSQRVDVTVKQNGEVHTISFKQGQPGQFADATPTSKFTPKKGLRVDRKMRKGEETGTTVQFWYDPSIFLKDARIDREVIVARARQTAFLVPGLTITLTDAREAQPWEETFHYTGGTTDMVEYLANDKKLSPPIHIVDERTFTETIPVLNESGQMENQDVERTCHIDIAYQWGNGYDTTIKSFVNVVSTPKHGTHVKGFERGLVNTIRKAYEGTRLLKANEEPPNLDDVVEGLTAVVSISVPEPQFLGQTKEELGTAGITKIVQETVAQHTQEWLNNKKNPSRTILEKIANASRVRLAARTQKEAARRKTALETASMPAKLVDCRTTGVKRSELFLVEGDSALGTCRNARNAEYQAILPLRGKILNVQRASMADTLKNAECSAIIQVLGAGSGRSFDVEQLRYHKILLLADADVDGSHIRTLLITLFFKYMRPVIEEGLLFAAMPPLHKIETTGRGKEKLFTYTAEEMSDTIARLEKRGATVKRPVQRYKGLGEMSAEELWDTTMNPGTRSVRRITVDDAEDASAMLELLMGNDVPSRRHFIMSNADTVKDIDA